MSCNACITAGGDDLVSEDTIIPVQVQAPLSRSAHTPFSEAPSPSAESPAPAAEAPAPSAESPAPAAEAPAPRAESPAAPAAEPRAPEASPRRRPTLGERLHSSAQSLRSSAQSLRGRFGLRRAKQPVKLHVYHVGHSALIHSLNSALECVTHVGVYHGGIEFRGHEWSFGGPSGTRGEAGYEPGGVYKCEPRANPAHDYHESLELGGSELSAADFASVIARLRVAWPGEGYDLCHRNCVHFCAALAAELGVGPVPEWVNAMAGAGATVEDAAGRVGQLVRTISRTISGRLVGTTAEEGETADAPPRRCCFVGSAPRRAAPAVSESATPEKEGAGV